MIFKRDHNRPGGMVTRRSLLDLLSALRLEHNFSHMFRDETDSAVRARDLDGSSGQIDADRIVRISLDGIHTDFVPSHIPNGDEFIVDNRDVFRERSGYGQDE